jgi:hypothetical protein
MLILLSMPLIGWCSFLARNAAFPQSVNFQAVPRPVLKDWLVVPGTGVGGLELGNSEEVISTLFPRPLVSRSPSLPECGMDRKALHRPLDRTAALTPLLRNSAKTSG